MKSCLTECDETSGRHKTIMLEKLSVNCDKATGSLPS